MKIKIVIKIKMDCEKCRSKALKIAAEVKGVISVSLDGDDKDHVVVIGDNVNTICLANQLQKKFRCVTIRTVEEVKPPKKQDKPPEDKEKEEQKKECCVMICFKCQSPRCSGQCSSSPCKSPKPKPEKECRVMICFKCQSPGCSGQCSSSPCKLPKPEPEKECCVTICFKCQSPRCSGQCSSSPLIKPPSTQSPSYNVQCPPWCTCIYCYVPYPRPPYCPYQVVYESNPDNCSIL